MRTLLAIVGVDDPHLPGWVGDLRFKGPILTLLQERSFDRVVLIVPAGREPDAESLRELITSCKVELHHLDALADPATVARHVDLLADGVVEIFALAGDALAEAGFCRAAVPMTLLRVILSADPSVDALIEEIPVNAKPSRVKEPRGLYAADEGATGLRTVDRSGVRDPKVVARGLGVVGEHPLLVREIEKAAAVAEHAVPVMIQGETGTGKGVMASLIHEMSDRSRGPFIAVNCSALPESLAESLLFGHVRGSFTGAQTDQAGKFVLADNGTLFLDEVGELPLALQPKLLRVLEDGLVEPLGSPRGRKVNVRVIAATHRDLKVAVGEKTFREDLYYRLSFATLTLPPLRERRSDIRLLALHILARLNRRMQRPKVFAPDALRHLESQYWRGNVRDLENVIGRSLLMSSGTTLSATDLLIEDMNPTLVVQTPDPFEGFSMEDFLSSVRADLIEKALRRTGGNQSAAARLLGISAQAVHKFTQSQKSNAG